MGKTDQRLPIRIDFSLIDTKPVGAVRIPNKHHAVPDHKNIKVSVIRKNLFPILRKIVTLDEAMDPENAKQNMIKTTEQIIRLVAAVK